MTNLKANIKSDTPFTINSRVCDPLPGTWVRLFKFQPIKNFENDFMQLHGEARVFLCCLRTLVLRPCSLSALLEYPGAMLEEAWVMMRALKGCGARTSCPGGLYLNLPYKICDHTKRVTNIVYTARNEESTNFIQSCYSTYHYTKHPNYIY